MLRTLIAAGLAAGAILAGGLLAARPAHASVFGAPEELFDMPRVIDLAIGADHQRLYGVGSLGPGAEPALASWTREEDGRLRLERIWRAADLDPSVAVYFAVALSPDQRFLYLAGRTFSYQSRIQVFARSGAALTPVETVASLPSSTGDGDLLMAASGAVLYYGSRGITSLAVNPDTGKLTSLGVSSTTSITRMLDNAPNGLLTVGEEVLTRWSVDGQGRALFQSSVPVQLAAGVTFSFATHLALSPDASLIYVLAYEDLQAGVQRWALLVYANGGDQALRSVALTGDHGTEPYSVLIHPENGALYWHRADQAQLVETRPATQGGLSFGEASVNHRYPLPQDLPTFRYAAAAFLGAERDLLLGSLVSRPWQLYRTGDGDELGERPTFRGLGHLIEPRNIVASPDGTLWSPSLRGDAVNSFVLGHGETEHVATRTGLGIGELLFLNDQLAVASLPLEGGIQRVRREENDLALTGPFTAVADPAFLTADPSRRHLYVTNGQLTTQVDLASLAVIGGAPFTTTQPPRMAPDGRSVLFNARHMQGDFPRFEAEQAQRDPASGALTPGPTHPGLLDGMDFAFSPDGRFVYTLRGGIAHLSVHRRDLASGLLGDFEQDLQLEPASPGRFHFDGRLMMDRDGRWLVAWLGLGSTLHVFARDPATGHLTARQVLTPAGAGFDPLGDRVELYGGPTANELYVVDSANNRILVFRRGCDTEDNVRCLGGRFRVETAWDTGSLQGDALPVPDEAADSGIFSFFNAGNWEMLVKVLDGCAINGHFWLFSAAATEVEHRLRVTDSVTGVRIERLRPAGPNQPALTDTEALAVCGPSQQGLAAPAPDRGAAGDLQLGAFRARLEWQTPAGLEGEGFPVPLQTAESGIFAFFSPNNWEMLVKVLDGCAINGHYWVFGAAATNVGYTLEIEAPGGARRHYVNPVGLPAPTISDTAAFPCGPTPSGG